MAHDTWMTHSILDNTLYYITLGILNNTLDIRHDYKLKRPHAIQDETMYITHDTRNDTVYVKPEALDDTLCITCDKKKMTTCK